MTAASDLIERLEAETGQRIDDNDGDNAAMAGLFGAMSRIMGQSPPSYRECDDVAVGVWWADADARRQDKGESLGEPW